MHLAAAAAAAIGQRGGVRGNINGKACERERLCLLVSLCALCLRQLLAHRRALLLLLLLCRGLGAVCGSTVACWATVLQSLAAFIGLGISGSLSVSTGNTNGVAEKTKTLTHRARPSTDGPVIHSSGQSSACVTRSSAACCSQRLSSSDVSRSARAWSTLGAGGASSSGCMRTSPSILVKTNSGMACDSNDNDKPRGSGA